MKKILATITIVTTVFISTYWTAFQAMEKAVLRALQSYSTSLRPIGSAAQGIIARLATTSSIAVGPGTSKNMLFTENTVCASRVITTGANPIMLSFASTEVAIATSTGYPGPNIGFLQAASTTISYDSGIYGCPAVSAYGYAASTTISIAEFR